MSRPAAISATVPSETLTWLFGEDSPAVAVLARRLFEGVSPDTADLTALWERRNEYAPIAAILDAQQSDGSWADPSQDYQKYQGSLWQIVFLGELWADPDDERVRHGAEYAFSRQHESGAWGSGPQPSKACPCLTANVARSLARMGYATDERVLAGLAWLVTQHRELGYLGCRGIVPFTMNGYCHMYTPKVLLFLAEVPEEAWPDGAIDLRDACVEALRDKEVFRSLPVEFKAFQERIWPLPVKERATARDAFVAKHSPIDYREKPGWLKFGFPLHYNSDALEALAALAAVGESARPEYEPALDVVRDAADPEMRWTMRTSLNGKMIADVEAKGEPSKWLTLRALTVLEHFGLSR